MTATFQWMTQNVSMPDFDRAKVEAWLVEVAGTHGRVARELSYVFCDDARIIEVNREFLKHDYYTDIITFDYCEGNLTGFTALPANTVNGGNGSTGAQETTGQWWSTETSYRIRMSYKSNSVELLTSGNALAGEGNSIRCVRDANY